MKCVHICHWTTNFSYFILMQNWTTNNTGAHFETTMKILSLLLLFFFHSFHSQKDISSPATILPKLIHLSFSQMLSNTRMATLPTFVLALLLKINWPNKACNLENNPHVFLDF